MTNAVEPAWQKVEQEAADELVGAERHDALPVRAIAAIILVAEGDAGRVEGKQPPVRDGDAMSVAREIGEHGFGPGEGRLGVDHPALMAERREVAQEGAPVSERREAAEESKPAGVVECDQSGEEQATKQLAEDAHRQEERRSRGDPALAIECDAAARHNHVHMRVVRQCRSPGVEHGGDADPCAQMAGIGGDRQHRLGRCLEQQVIDRGLVVERDVGDLGRQCEDDVEVSDRQQVGLALGQPGARGGALALGAVPVAAAVIGDPLVAAVLAGLDMTAQGGGAAMLDRRHDLELLQAQVPGMGGPVSGAGSTEDIGDLERGAHRLRRRGRLARA